MIMNCLFCKIVNGIVPAEIVKRNERITAFKDIAPQAPIHILVIPNTHFENMAHPMLLQNSPTGEGVRLQRLQQAIGNVHH